MKTSNGMTLTGTPLAQAVESFYRGSLAVVDANNTLLGILTFSNLANAVKSDSPGGESVDFFMNQHFTSISYDVFQKSSGNPFAALKPAIASLPVIDGDGKFLFFVYREDYSQNPPIHNQSWIGDRSEYNYLFIMGCAKSGTTWLRNILAGHPAIRVLQGEGHLATHALDDLLEFQKKYNGYPYGFTIADEHLYLSARRLFSLLLNDLAEGSKDVKYVAEKTPQYTMRLKQLYRLFPEAKVVSITRDPKDVVVSHWFNERRNAYHDNAISLADLDAPITDEFVQYAAKSWADAILSHFCDIESTFKGQSHTVKYENLVYDGDKEIAGLLDFLGVDGSAASIASCSSHGSFKRNSGGRENSNEDRTNFYRKGIVGDHKEHLTERQIEMIQSISQNARSLAGY